jgi:hypothetical protein
MKIHQIPPSFLFRQGFSPPFEGKNPFDKILAEMWIVKPSVLFNRQKGKVFHKCPGEYPNPLSNGGALFIVNLHPFHATAGRTTPEDKPAKVVFLQLSDPFTGPPDHAARIVYFRPRGNQAG